MAKADKNDKMTFEEAMGRIEEIADQMESADLPLDQVIAKYEEGIKLIDLCGEKLKAAEKKIELLTRKKTGEVVSSNFDDEAKTPLTPTQDSDDEATLL